MKKITYLVSILWISCSLYSQQTVLKFNSNKKFKIVQFTDVHYISGDERSDVAIENINETLEQEKPDLVLFTGDLIFDKPAEKNIRTVLELVSKRKIPFGVTFGNHDDEHDINRSDLYNIVRSIPYNLTNTEPGISGITNYILPVLSSNTNKPATILYCFDSNSYSLMDDIDGYDYIKFDQIAWYRTQSLAYTKQNGGTPIPSLAFFHIPLPEYNQAAGDETGILTGTRKEKACAPKLNSGLFLSMKELGDVKGVFVGHDHDDDYAVYWKGILLAYGRYGGGNTVYNNLKPNGSRVIELTEGQEGFRTWIRLRGGEKIHDVQYPDFFLKKKD